MSSKMDRLAKCAHQHGGGLAAQEQKRTPKGDARELIRDPNEEEARLQFVRQRSALGWSQPRAAFELGVSESSVISWESKFDGAHAKIPAHAANRMRRWAHEQAGVDSNGRIRVA